MFFWTDDKSVPLFSSASRILSNISCATNPYQLATLMFAVSASRMECCRLAAQAEKITSWDHKVLEKDLARHVAKDTTEVMADERKSRHLTREV